MALTICTWLWGDKYSDADVRKLAGGFDRHLKQPSRFFVAKPFGPEVELTKIRGCFCRLRMFDPEWQRLQDIEQGDRLVCVDLDVVITGALDPLFDRDDSFTILQGANAVNPCPFNGSLMMLRAGAHPDVWSDFSIDAAQRIPYFEYPDDQGWLHHKLPTASVWQCGSASGVYGFQKPGWPKGDALPADARMVVFPGWRSPEKFKHLTWIKEHWRE